MNLWLKIGVPVVLGVAAALINWQVLQSELEPHYFVKVKRDMKAGELFKKGDLEKLTIKSSDGPGSLHGTAVKWENAAMLFDVPCVRDLKANDIVFLRDGPSRFKVVALGKKDRALHISLDGVKYEPSLLMVGKQIGFVVDPSSYLEEVGTNTKGALGPRSYVVVGPFQIVSVGRRVSVQAETDPSDNQAARSISVAIKTDIRDDGAETLDEQANRLVQAAEVRMRGGQQRSAIEGIVLYPFN